MVESVGYTIRKEKGSFRGDHCVLEGEKVVLVNKNRPVDLQIGLYARLLKDKLDDSYIKPALRKELEALWDRFEQQEQIQKNQPDPEDRINIEIE